MRILIATWSRNLVGGAEKYLQTIIPGLLERGHAVAVAYERSYDRERETIDGGLAGLPAWCLMEQGRSTLLHEVAEWRPDIVYSQGLQDGDLQSALLDRYPNVLFAHGYYGTCITGTKCHSFPQVRPCSRRFGPMCLLMHYPRRCGGLNPWNAWQSFRHAAERNAQLSRYRTVVVASRHMKQEFSTNGVNSDKIQIVSLPVIASVEETEPLSEVPPGRILLIARLTDIKGGHYLIRAIPAASKQLGRPLTLRIAGDGPDRPGLERLARELQVEAEFVGWVDAAQRFDLLRNSDLLAVPSLWPEPFGLVGLEAASLSVPAVGYAVGGITDWLVPGQSGELAPGDPPSVPGLTDALVRAFSDPAHYAKLRLGARQVACRFTLTAHLDRLESILSARSYAFAG